MYPILRKLPLLPLFLFLAVALAGPARAGDAFLVRDIDTTGGEVGPGDGCAWGTCEHLYQGSYPRDLVSLGDRVVFVATDRIHGSELWSSDGTVEGTRRITDLCPGQCNSVAAIIGVLKGRVLFWASHDPATPPHLWSSDGTTGGTAPVAEVCDSPCPLAKSEWERFGQQPWPTNARRPRPLHAVFGDRLFFFAAGDDGAWTELWASDGTPAGTRRMADACPGECSWVPNFLVAGGDGVYAVGYDANGEFPEDYEVWFAGPEDDAARRIFTSPRSGAEGHALRMNDVEVAEGRLHVAVEGEDGRPASLWRVTPQEALLLWQAESTPGTFTELTEAGGELYFVQVDRLFRPGPPTEGIYDLWVLEEDGARPLSGRFSTMRSGVELPDGRLAILAEKELDSGFEEVYLTSGQDLEKWPEYPGGRRFVTQLREVDGRLLIQDRQDFHLPDRVWVGDGADHLHRLLELEAGNDLQDWTVDDLDHWTAAGDYLFFGADDAETGRELWAVPRRSLEPRASERLLEGRFDVSVLFENQHAGDEVGAAVARRLTEDSSQFWFFREENTELVVKVLDGFGVNGHAWVFHGGTTNLGYRVTVRDRETDRTRVYHRPPGTLCGAGDTTAFELFSPLGGNGSVASVAPLAAPAVRSSRSAVATLDLPAPCDPDTALCLGGDRFQVRVRFRNHRADGAEGVGQPVVDTDRAGWFWFFDPDNTEVMVKVLDGRPVNGYHWVLWGGLTDLEYELEVNDLLEGVTRIYRHEAGDLCGGADTAAFTTGDPSTALGAGRR